MFYGFSIFCLIAAAPVPADANADATAGPVPSETAAAEPQQALAAAPVNENADSGTLFILAAIKAQSGNDPVAVQLYTRLIERFPNDARVIAARFNRGLLREAHQEWQAAVDDYQALLKQAPVTDLGTDPDRTFSDARFRLAACLGKLGQWWPAVGALDAALQQPGLSDADRLEAEIGRGIAMQEAGDPNAAEAALGSALLHLDALNRKEHFDDAGLGAEAAFRLGDIARARYSATQLAFPVPLLRERLESKCEALVLAQNRYIRAIRYGDAHTVAAAGLRIGDLYASLYNTIVGLAPPPDLTAEEREIYQEEVRAKVAVLAKKAIVVYEKSLSIGRHAPDADAWVQQLEQALAHLQSVYLNDQRGLTQRVESGH